LAERGGGLLICNRGLTREEEEVESEKGDKRLEVNRMRRWMFHR